jgi:GlpG protein
MHKLARFDDPALAAALDEQLSRADIPTVVRGEGAAQVIWLVAEQDLPKAQAVLARFVHQVQAQSAAVSGAEAAPAGRMQKLWQGIAASPVTASLLVACVVVALYTALGDNREQVEQFTIARMPRAGSTHWSAWDDLRAGQLWRLFTPVLLHFHPLHLLFNASMLLELGVASERLQGPLKFSVFLLWTALVSNLAQLIFGHSPNFGGASGVVYALIGYLWTRGSFDPYSGFALAKGYVVFPMVLMALGFTGVLDGVLGGGIANYCHLGGFAAGAVYGYIAARIATSRRQKASLLR